MDSLDRIDAYVRNEMTDEERQSFEEALARRPQLASDCAFVRDVVVALAERESKLAKMDEWQVELDVEEILHEPQYDDIEEEMSAGSVMAECEMPEPNAAADMEIGGKIGRRKIKLTKEHAYECREIKRVPECGHVSEEEENPKAGVSALCIALIAVAVLVMIVAILYFLFF